MLVLGVDTSTDFLSVSLVDGRKILAEYNAVGRLEHSSLLMPTVNKALRKARRKINDINLCAVGLGPGSFTGLRVGVTAVRALAIALKKPIVGVPTMDAIAHNGLIFLKKARMLGSYTKICPILDAKKKQLYACIYRHNGDKIIRETDYLLQPVKDLRKRLKKSILFLGDAVSLYKNELSHKKGLKAHFLDSQRWLPKAKDIARMALERYEKDKGDNPYDLVPLYLYARDCNVKK